MLLEHPRNVQIFDPDDLVIAHQSRRFFVTVYYKQDLISGNSSPFIPPLKQGVFSATFYKTSNRKKLQPKTIYIFLRRFGNHETCFFMNPLHEHITTIKLRRLVPSKQQLVIVLL